MTWRSTKSYQGKAFSHVAGKINEKRPRSRVVLVKFVILKRQERKREKFPDSKCWLLLRDPIFLLVLCFHEDEEIL